MPPPFFALYPSRQVRPQMAPPASAETTTLLGSNSGADNGTFTERTWRFIQSMNSVHRYQDEYGRRLHYPLACDWDVEAGGYDEDDDSVVSCTHDDADEPAFYGPSSEGMTLEEHARYLGLPAPTLELVRCRAKMARQERGWRKSELRSFRAACCFWGFFLVIVGSVGIATVLFYRMGLI